MVTKEEYKVRQAIAKDFGKMGYQEGKKSKEKKLKFRGFRKPIFKNPQGKLSDIREALGVPRFLFGK